MKCPDIVHGDTYTVRVVELAEPLPKIGMWHTAKAHVQRNKKNVITLIAFDGIEADPRHDWDGHGLVVGNRRIEIFQGGAA